MAIRVTLSINCTLRQRREIINGLLLALSMTEFVRAISDHFGALGQTPTGVRLLQVRCLINRFQIDSPEAKYFNYMTIQDHIQLDYLSQSDSGYDFTILMLGIV